jgi:hypothetical protein
VAPPETHILINQKPLFTIERDNFKDVVVWNPYIEGAASMGDFEPKDGWKNMVYPWSPSFKEFRFVWKPAVWPSGYKFLLLVDLGKENRLLELIFSP